MNFFLDIARVGTSQLFEYENKFNVNTKFARHITDQEKQRRVKLFLEATQQMNDYANQARNAIIGTPQKVLIVFDDKLSRKASRYFVANPTEQKNIIEELEDRNSVYFLGDDTQGETSVYKAYKSALAFIDDTNNTLYDPCNADTPIQTYKETFEHLDK